MNFSWASEACYIAYDHHFFAQRTIHVSINRELILAWILFGVIAGALLKVMMGEERLAGLMGLSGSMTLNSMARLFSVRSIKVNLYLD